MKKSIFKTVALAAPVMLLGQTAHATVSDEQFDAMKTQMQAQFAALANRVVELEKLNLELMSANNTQASSNLVMIESLNDKVSVIEKQEQKTSWADRIQWKGDFRYRYEDIQQDGEDDRDRQRIRARPALVAQVDENVKVGFGLVTGGDDPVSGNQTLGGGGSTKGINLDLAYFEYKLDDSLTLIGGKFKTPFHQPAKDQLIWDGDFRPEGLAVKFKEGDFFATAMYNILESDSKNGKIETFSTQVGFNGDFSDDMSYLIGGGYYHVPSAGNVPTFDADDFQGNSTELTLDGLAYKYDYTMAQVFGELNFSLAEMPVKLWGDYVNNSDADDNDTAWATGFIVGKAKNPGEWKFAATYKDIEKDAVLGVITDSDFGGGGTDSKGWKLGVGYAVSKKTSLGLSYFINEIGSDEIDYDRLQMDMKFKY